ncbi:unnamed protein product [Fusarium venenatum]|uniref:Uncharacterized protein n=1 Tax=Fusarium venenatum TaxID=56646 RepID=A0A2L2STC4_9HYPO|nr:uncharacterized protein FVRRES_11356 [Fusarium venenatum]CEI38665.1 unnamed protein product [Fusarium venenatum]
MVEVVEIILGDMVATVEDRMAKDAILDEVEVAEFLSGDMLAIVKDDGDDVEVKNMRPIVQRGSMPGIVELKDANYIAEPVGDHARDQSEYRVFSIVYGSSQGG